MSIRPHPSHKGWYVVDHYPEGRKGKREREPFPSYDKAVQFEQALSKQKSSPAVVLHPRLEDVVDEYLIWAKKEKSPITYIAKERRLQNYVIPFFGKYRVKDIDQNVLDNYSANMKKWMYASDMGHLFALIRWMIKRKYALKLTWEPERVTGNHAIKTVPHPSDIMAAIDSMPKEKHRVLFRLMLYSGLRWNEARNIRWEDIDLRSGSIRLKEIVDGPQDIIYIPEPLQEWFTANAKTAGYVFESDKFKGRPVSNLWKVLEDASKVCGSHLSTHTFRHASGTYLYEQERDIYQVQAHLRHAKVTTSQIYARMSISRKKSGSKSVFDYVDNNR